MPWDDIYFAFAKALEKRGVVNESKVELADDAALANIGKALGTPPEYVPVQMGGKYDIYPNILSILVTENLC